MCNFLQPLGDKVNKIRHLQSRSVPDGLFNEFSPSWSPMFLSCFNTQSLYSLDSSVRIATRYGLDCPGIGSQWRLDFPHSSRLALGPTQPPIRWVLGHSRGLKRPGYGVNHPLPSSAEVKERVALYLYSASGPSWFVIGWILHFVTLYSLDGKTEVKRPLGRHRWGHHVEWTLKRLVGGDGVVARINLTYNRHHSWGFVKTFMRFKCRIFLAIWGTTPFSRRLSLGLGNRKSIWGVQVSVAPCDVWEGNA